jgi:DNA polymerase-1
MDENIQKARDDGYVSTIMGRRRYLKDIHSQNSIVRGNAERNAINAPVQGSAADLIKVAMIRIFNRFKEENLKSKMLIQVHDELNFEVPEEELNTVREIVRYEMENAFHIDVPLLVDVGIGQNWFEAH